MSFRDFDRTQTMTAEMQPDLYGGDDCDQRIPQWFTYGEGDKDGDTSSDPLELFAANFPPGTQVLVMEPVCPLCGETRALKNFPNGPGFQDKCACGFDWRAWEEEHYS